MVSGQSSSIMSSWGDWLYTERQLSSHLHEVCLLFYFLEFLLTWSSYQHSPCIFCMHTSACSSVFLYCCLFSGVCSFDILLSMDPQFLVFACPNHFSLSSWSFGLAFVLLLFLSHTCQWLRFGRSHYVFLDKLITTGVVGKDYGFMLVWRCHFFGNHLITFGLFLVEVMGLSQYCWPTNIVRLCFWRSESIPLTNNHRSPLFLELRISARRKQWPTSCRADAATGIYISANRVLLYCYQPRRYKYRPI